MRWRRRRLRKQRAKRHEEKLINDALDELFPPMALAALLGGWQEQLERMYIGIDAAWGWIGSGIGDE